MEIVSYITSEKERDNIILYIFFFIKFLIRVKIQIYCHIIVIQFWKLWLNPDFNVNNVKLCKAYIMASFLHVHLQIAEILGKEEQ